MRCIDIRFICPHVRIHHLRCETVTTGREFRMLKREIIIIFVRIYSLKIDLNLTIASVAGSWDGLSGWSTTSSLIIIPDGGVSNDDIWTVDGIDVTLLTSCGVFGALTGSDGNSYKRKAVFSIRSEFTSKLIYIFCLSTQKFQPWIDAVVWCGTLLRIDLQQKTFSFAKCQFQRFECLLRTEKHINLIHFDCWKWWKCPHTW